MGRVVVAGAPGAPACRTHEFVGPFEEFLARHFPAGPRGLAHQLSINGRFVPPEDYERTVIEGDTEAALVFTPAGFDPFTLAVILVVTVAVSLALTPTLSAPGADGAAQDDPARVYSVTSQANKARLGGVIPVAYGTAVWTPDYASQSYRVFENNDEIRWFLLCLGQGVVDVETLRIGDTAVSDLPAGLVDWAVFHPDQHGRRQGPLGDAFGLHENVATSTDVGQQELGGRFKFQGEVEARFSGDVLSFSDAAIAAEAKPGDRLIVRQSPADGDYVVDTVDGANVRVTTPLKGSGARRFHLGILSGPSSTLGPFAANPAMTRTDRIEIDVEFPGGLHNRASDGKLVDWTVEIEVRVQPIDDDGGAAGAVIARRFSETAATIDPQRRTYVLDNLPPARYRVSVRRTDLQNLDRESDRTIWTGLKAYLLEDDAPAYGDVTLLAVRIRAAQQLSGASQNKIFAVTKKRVTPYEGGSPVFSANPADVLADMVLDPLYGAAQASARLSEEGFAAFHESQATRSGFNGVFDRETTLFEAMKAVCLVGYAQPVPLGARLTIVEDGPRPVRRSIVTPDNIKRGSFKLDVAWRGQGRHDGYLVEFSDAATFGKREAIWPAGARRPKRAQVRGLIDPAEAAALARYFWAQEELRNIDVSFEMEWDALNFNRFDRVGVALPLFDWGSGAQLAAFEGRALTLDRDGAPDGACWVCLRDQDGSSGAVHAATGDGARTLLLSSDPDVELVCDGRSVATLIAWGRTEDFLQDVSIDKISPAGPVTRVTAKFYRPELFEGRI